MIERPSRELEAYLRTVFNEFRCTEKASDDKDLFDFVFHMTDWLDDLRKYAELCKNPEGFTLDEARDAIVGMLAHASGHIVAAARMTDFFGDPFSSQPDDDEPPRSIDQA